MSSKGASGHRGASTLKMTVVVPSPGIIAVPAGDKGIESSFLRVFCPEWRWGPRAVRKGHVPPLRREGRIPSVGGD